MRASVRRRLGCSETVLRLYERLAGPVIQCAPQVDLYRTITCLVVPPNICLCSLLSMRLGPLYSMMRTKVYFSTCIYPIHSNTLCAHRVSPKPGAQHSFKLRASGRTPDESLPSEGRRDPEEEIRVGYKRLNSEMTSYFRTCRSGTR